MNEKTPTSHRDRVAAESVPRALEVAAESAPRALDRSGDAPDRSGDEQEQARVADKRARGLCARCSNPSQSYRCEPCRSARRAYRAQQTTQKDRWPLVSKAPDDFVWSTAQICTGLRLTRGAVRERAHARGVVPVDRDLEVLADLHAGPHVAISDEALDACTWTLEAAFCLWTPIWPYTLAKPGEPDVRYFLVAADEKVRGHYYWSVLWDEDEFFSGSSPTVEGAARRAQAIFERLEAFVAKLTRQQP